MTGAINGAVNKAFSTFGSETRINWSNPERKSKLNQHKRDADDVAVANRLAHLLMERHMRGLDAELPRLNDIGNLVVAVMPDDPVPVLQIRPDRSVMFEVIRLIFVLTQCSCFVLMLNIEQGAPPWTTVSAKSGK